MDNEHDSSGAVKRAITHRIVYQHGELFQKYGLEAVERAIEEKASSFQGQHLDEIGSSDISCWVTDIEASLKRAKPTEPTTARQAYAQESAKAKELYDAEFVNNPPELRPKWESQPLESRVPWLNKAAILLAAQRKRREKGEPE